MARIPYFDPEHAPERVLHAMAGKRKINIFRMIRTRKTAPPRCWHSGKPRQGQLPRPCPP